MGAKAYILELDQIGMLECAPGIKKMIANTLLTDDGAALQDALEDITKQRSVPNIFIGQKHIGGNSELQAKKSQLSKLLKEANAI
jgi:glutaredoxin 3